LRRAVQEIAELRGHVNGLELDNRRLREALQEAEAEANRLYRELQPLPPGSVDYSQPGIHVVGIDSDLQQPTKRGWRRPRGN
jgi:hypothetical protein